jgi:hypothetical protein
MDARQRVVGLESVGIGRESVGSRLGTRPSRPSGVISHSGTCIIPALFQARK